VKKYWPLLVVILPLGILASSLVMTLVTLHRNEQASKRIGEAFHAQYPEIILQSGWSYESARVYLFIYGVKEPDAQIEMKSWLEGLKAQRGETVTVCLTF
jgi:hypothetical protein